MVIDPPAIVIRPAARDFSDWERVRLLILDAFAYMGPRIDPPSSALRLTPKSIQASAESGRCCSPTARVIWSAVYFRTKRTMHSTSASWPSARPCNALVSVENWWKPHAAKRACAESAC